MNLLWIASGGAIGALLRYGIYRKVDMAAQSVFPFGILCVNISGSFVAASIAGWLAGRTGMEGVSLFLLTGICGAMTTFS
ncbi:MAG: CrcB family protein, partial [Pseudomonadota bacterium]